MWPRALYVVMIVFSLLSCHTYHLLQGTLKDLHDSVAAAMRLVTDAVWEETEAMSDSYQAFKDIKAETELVHESEMLDKRVKEEQALSKKLDDKASVFENMAHREFQMAQDANTTLQQDEAVEAQLDEKLDHDVQERDELVEKLRSYHQGMCGLPGISKVCMAVGQATEIQQELDAVGLQIHNEWKESIAMGEQEHMQEITVSVLNEKSKHFEDKAQRLEARASYLRTQEAKDEQQLNIDHEEAQALLEQAMSLRKRAKEEISWEKIYATSAYEKIQEAEKLHKLAIHRAIAALWVGLGALIYFMYRLANGIANLAHDFYSYLATEPSGMSILNRVSFVFQHVVVFCLTCSVLGHDLGNIGFYDQVERAVVVFWFSIVAASIQTVVVHLVPQIRVGAELLWKELVKRHLVLAMVFILELIGLLVVTSPSLFNGLSLQNPFIFVACAFPLLAHMAFCEPVSNGSDDLTVLDDGSSVFTETTPLRASDRTVSTGEELVRVDLGWHGRDVSTSSRPRYYIWFLDEVSIVALGLEAVIVVLLSKIAWRCVPAVPLMPTLAFGLCLVVLLGYAAYCSARSTTAVITKLPYEVRATV